MPIINTNGQTVTSESPAQEQQQQQRVALTPAEAQRIIGAYARLKELTSSAVSNPKDDAEKAGLQNFLTGAFFTHAEEFFGCWVTLNQEYIPLITGFTALMNRALARIDAQAKFRSQAAQASAVTETPDKNS